MKYMNRIKFQLNFLKNIFYSQQQFKMLGFKRNSQPKIFQRRQRSLLNIHNLISRPSTAEYIPFKRIDQLLEKNAKTIKVIDENPVCKKSKVLYEKVSNRRISKKVIRNPSIRKSTLRSEKTLLDNSTSKLISSKKQIDLGSNLNKIKLIYTENTEKFVPYEEQKNYVTEPYISEDTQQSTKQNEIKQTRISSWKNEEEYVNFSALLEKAWKM